MAWIPSLTADVEDEGVKLPPREVILKGEDSILRFAAKIKDAKMLGKLDLSGMGLRNLPLQVCTVFTYFRSTG